jgi:hypothetical protein
VAGVVVESDTGRPVPAARVDVLDRAGDVVGTIPLDPGGGFSLDNVAPGTYVLRVTGPCAGSTYEMTVTVPPQTYVVLPVDCPTPPVQVPPVQLPQARAS